LGNAIIGILLGGEWSKICLSPIYPALIFFKLQTRFAATANNPVVSRYSDISITYYFLLHSSNFLLPTLYFKLSFAATATATATNSVFPLTATLKKLLSTF
jgi:hypothetical protein